MFLDGSICGGRRLNLCSPQHVNVDAVCLIRGIRGGEITCLAKTITRFTTARTFVYGNQLSRLYIELLLFIDSPFVVVVLAHDVTASGLFLFER